MKDKVQPAFGSQPAIIDGIDNGDKRGDDQQRGKDHLPTVPHGGDKEKGDNKKQTFLMHQLRGKTQ